MAHAVSGAPLSAPVVYPLPISAPATIASHAEIADRAYEIWLNAGQPANRDLENWLQAEAELNGTLPTSRPAVIRDEASRLTADPLDPAASPAAELQAEIESIGGSTTRRSATSL